MSDVTVSRNHEGAIVVDAICSDGEGSFLETMRFYYYTKKEAVALFKQHCKDNGYMIMNSEGEYA
jgi:hypothetical protein